MLKDKMTNEDWFDHVYESTKEILVFALNDLGFEKEKAIAYTKEKTNAGWLVWEKILNELEKGEISCLK